jgi:hypothetical protein
MASREKNKETNFNNFLIILKHTTNGFDKQCKKIREINTSNRKVCYVCLSEPYTSVIEDLKDENLGCDNVFFVDALSNPLYALKPIHDCIFVRGMNDLELLQRTVKKVIKSHNCSAIVFDAISALLVYQPSHSIVRFTHELLRDESAKETKKIYITLKDTGIFKEESTKLINDLNLFADNIIELGK